MSETGCTVTIDGSYSGEYYIPCDMVGFFIDGLINTSNSTINLYKDIRHYNNDYDYIRCSPYQYPLYYRANTSSRIELTDITSMQFNSKANYYLNRDYINLFVLFLLALFSLKVIFKRG